MSNGVKIFLEYRVKKGYDQLYYDAMADITYQLAVYEAEQIEWFLISPSSNRYRETFYVPTESHYYALKKLRKTKYHNIFGFLDDMIEGGVNGIQWIGLSKISTISL